MNVLLFGPPGVGKGTQGQRLAREVGIVHLAMGDLLREAVRQGTEAGKKAKAYMDAGELVPDELVVRMIEDRIHNVQGFLLDGFPRNVAQARALDAMLDRQGLHLDAIVFMDASEETLLERLTGRLICRACGFGFHRHYSPPKIPGVCDQCGGELYQREDDREDVIADRLRVYREQTAPLLSYYRNRPVFGMVDANGGADEVYEKLLRMVKQADG
ncbi:MAG: adenylate kinase [Zetaproteobacteria bacterium]|nr:MAG: adenylate kinase [Zetaproteobacteria bacterium]